MVPSYLLVDFHAHLRGTTALQLPDDRSGIYLKELADLMEPLTRQVAGLCGMHFRDPFSRFLYRSINDYAVQEVKRVFEKYTVELLIQSMDRSGIGHTVVCPIDPFFSTQDLAQAIQPYPGKFSLFATADPARLDCLERLERDLSDHPVVGLKLNPARAESVSEEKRMTELLALAQSRSLPVFIHTGAVPFETEGFDDLTALGEVCAAFPRVSITIAHIGWDQHAKVIALAERFHHVSVETSWQPPKVIRQAVDRLGVHRVLMGSDFPLLQQTAAYDNVTQALTPLEARAVSSRNAQRLLGLAS
ncbi:MAG: amidohydrolase family protein [Candidatus Sericytochromatia bacterium]|nr:amidohydrolase family protein [Candidatus Sericytochromatia bacterium]